MVSGAHLRVARPTNSLEALLPFYVDGLGFEVIGGFPVKDGFDGIMLGHKDAAYHLEFTRKVDHDAGRSPGQDNLLVFYLPDDGEYQRVVARMAAAGFSPVASFNPYWDEWGVTFEDPDGYRAVLAHRGWSN